MKIRNRIPEILEEKDLTIADFSVLLGRSYSHAHHLCNDDLSFKRFETIIDISIALNVTIEDLFILE